MARRVVELDTEVVALDEILVLLVAATVPALVAEVGVSTDTAGALLVAAGENSGRLRNERSYPSSPFGTVDLTVFPARHARREAGGKGR
jgi:hypothetical protein